MTDPKDPFDEIEETWECPKCDQENDGEYCVWCLGWKDELLGRREEDDV